MKCVVCKKGGTKAGTTTITLEKNGATLVVKSEAARSGIQVEIRQYNAA